MLTSFSSSYVGVWLDDSWSHLLHIHCYPDRDLGLGTHQRVGPDTHAASAPRTRLSASRGVLEGLYVFHKTSETYLLTRNENVVFFLRWASYLGYRACRRRIFGRSAPTTTLVGSNLRLVDLIFFSSVLFNCGVTVGCRWPQVSADADPTYVVRHAQLIFRGVGVSQLFVQLDYEYNKNTYANLQSSFDQPPYQSSNHDHDHEHSHGHQH